MKKIFSLLCLLLCLHNTSQARTPHPFPDLLETWEHVVTGFSNNRFLKVERVEFFTDRTEVQMFINFRPGVEIYVQSSTVLIVGNKQYKVKGMSDYPPVGAYVFDLDKKFVLPDSGKVRFELAFEPLPADTRQFNLEEPSGWTLLNIRNADALHTQHITDTYWRNEDTGEWLIGFAKSHIVYDNRVWDIRSQTEKKDSYDIFATHGKDSIAVRVDKFKKGQRNIRIETFETCKACPFLHPTGKKSIACTPITGASLPDYPTLDLRQGFKDNGYREGDSVTIIGWLKDIPEMAYQRMDSRNAIQLYIDDFIRDEQISHTIHLDSIGRFRITIPLLNSAECYIDCSSSAFSTVLEAGETYFLLKDFGTGQTLFMGKDVRLQNELLATSKEYFPNLRERNLTNEQLMQYLSQTDSLRTLYTHQALQLVQQRPHLSQRYKNFIEGYYKCEQGRDLMQARFRAPDRRLPKEYIEYVTNELWMPQKPYTLYTSFNTFMRDYIDHQDEATTEGQDYTTTVLKFVEEGIIHLTEAEKQTVKRLAEEQNVFKEKINTLHTQEEQQALIDEFSKNEVVVATMELLNKHNDAIQQALEILNCKRPLNHISCDKELHDLHIVRTLWSHIYNTCKPLTPSTIEWMGKQITLEGPKAIVMAGQNKYLAIQNGDFASASLRSADDVKGMSDGEKMLRKIIEPYKGKIILIDVWGTWCSPCKAALAKSQLLYDDLKDYDMVFLYLANRSDETSWKNVINEYQVTGDNVVHYNLPTEQQAAIERFLRVKAFPTYRLVNKEGHILDINADPRNVNILKSNLQKVK